jgi:tetratricopeptide (TPR) repeat protein
LRILLRGALAWLAVAVAGAQPQWPAAVQELFQRGVEAQKAGRLEEAERAFQDVLKQGGKASFVHNNLGIVYQAKRDHEAALAQFREAIRLDANYAAPRILAGVSLVATGKFAAAATELEMAVKLAPGEPQGRLQLAWVLERRGRLEQAAEQYRELRKLVPNEPEYAYRLGKMYLKLAAKYFQKMAAAAPSAPRTLQLKGENLAAIGKEDSAIESFRKALSLDPKQPGLHLVIAQIYAKQGKREEALKEVEAELAILPDNASALAMRSQLMNAAPAR